jgi:hypothetical protein
MVWLLGEINNIAFQYDLASRPGFATEGNTNSQKIIFPFFVSFTEIKLTNFTVI